MTRTLILSACLTGMLSALAGASALAAEPVVLAPVPALDVPLTKVHGTATAILSGGCFWAIQDVFRHVHSVPQAVSGYTGGAASTAHYEVVSTGSTCHAKSLKITYEASVISYGTLLRIFVSVAANPTELDYQGPDEGTQYRSMIWVENAKQREVADAYLKQLAAAHTFDARIATQIATAMPYFRAEAYHQNYAALHPYSPYIPLTDAPKVVALRKLFWGLYREKPTQVRIASNG